MRRPQPLMLNPIIGEDGGLEYSRTYISVDHFLPEDDELVYVRGIHRTSPGQIYAASAQYSSSHQFVERNEYANVFTGVYEWWSPRHYVTMDHLKPFIEEFDRASDKYNEIYLMEIIYPEGNGPWLKTRVGEFGLKFSLDGARGTFYFVVSCNEMWLDSISARFEEWHSNLADFHKNYNRDCNGCDC